MPDLERGDIASKDNVFQRRPRGIITIVQQGLVALSALGAPG
ncbi:hypothetical protein AGROH133_14317 (plasmid) [Agrobacterium tumefaciens]|nr:hypothetical protein AGROH133_14317 [Agrobacterium tumefaciens]